MIHPLPWVGFIISSIYLSEIPEGHTFDDVL